MEKGKKLRVIVWDCEKGKVANDFMTNALVCGYDEEMEGQEQGRHRFSIVYLSSYDKGTKIRILKYMMEGCRNLIKKIRREKESG